MAPGNDWHQFVGVIGFANNHLETFVDGNLDSSKDVSTLGAATSNTPSSVGVIGLDENPSRFQIFGTIEEVRVAATRRSAAGIRAEYLSMTNQLLFVGEEEVS